MSDKSVKRLFIGNMTPALVLEIDDFVSRLSKFGEIKSELEIHFNEVRNTSFGYIDLEIDDKEYAKLKNSLNGVKYKGSKLVIDVAKESYQKEWQRHHDDKNLEEKKLDKILKQQWEFFKKIENINKSFTDRQEMIPGRLRKTPRKDIKSMTFRVIINDTVKIIKPFKTKLWGYERNKKLRDLSYKFQNGVWKDGNDHVIERLSAIQLKQGNNVLRIEKINERDENLIINDEEEEKEEQDKNNKVLASILGNFNFDKELDYKEEIDEFGDSDYEYEGKVKDSDDEKIDQTVDLSAIEYVKEGEYNKDSKLTSKITYDSDDDDFNDDIYDKANMGFSKHTPKEQEKEKEDEDEPMEDSEEEFIPTFGQSTEATGSNLVSGTVSNTETLRGLFNPNDVSSFKLIEEDDDIDSTKQIIQTDIKLPEFEINPIISKSRNKKSLFFPHFESPFLVAQTQINKLNSNVEFNDWNTEFWEKRSEWTRDLKRRKRDVLRQIRKKNAKNFKSFV